MHLVLLIALAKRKDSTPNTITDVTKMFSSKKCEEEEKAKAVKRNNFDKNNNSSNKSNDDNDNDKNNGIAIINRLEFVHTIESKEPVVIAWLSALVFCRDTIKMTIIKIFNYKTSKCAMTTIDQTSVIRRGNIRALREVVGHCFILSKIGQEDNSGCSCNRRFPRRR